MKRPPNVPDSELEVLKVLWDRGASTIREVLTVLEEQGKTWCYATVATLLDRLASKGMAVSLRRGHLHIYKAKVTPNVIEKRRISHLVEHLYNGESGRLVLHLLRNHRLAPHEIEEVRHLLDEMSQPKPKPKAKSLAATRPKAANAPASSSAPKTRRRAK
ncbi:transcriptional repressor, CopY family [Isosphaera pallida ATCC 43644]|jgi:predicted transcriptional regulator|uniref:Transcriptional repressor, CopY family n=1 Tax=Isosphaera pallida (strain ATCC 43644 / DSM 9630 / IS1B) TaxID=575540 RepID=E8QWI3_ISOPI|nr:BlaI/MecI/CopY family transcriptional regulator [Isosphaera pallida]ADV61875.1 transcriptional repressor, CopY family [Isosphaera pallida ATCC 43644]